ncbi:hypothetical protein Agub_g3982 [Astrephomene gubernaculifera]|uniref:Uncharacterized protein n=1 Tax=Astrephomene gubernaculifera TaxID=47775 RepID=A0AAD3DLV9_9CHLO|nr:hypothetical protein Agub_g3982 [Astrephomene gubernaculifera]
MSTNAIPSKLSKVTIPGASLSTTLYSVTAGGAPCDGLLFGNTISTTTHQLQDDDDAATMTESRAAICSTLCCATTCSFYDGGGDIAESKLQALLKDRPGPLLGWLSYRPAVADCGGGSSSSGGSSTSVPLRPSMRESAVTQALLQRQLQLASNNRDASSSSSTASGRHAYGGGQGQHGGAGAQEQQGRPMQAVLLLLVTTGRDHNGATVTWQFRCFQARQAVASGELLLEPLELQTLNLGGHTGLADYQKFNTTTAYPLSSGLLSSATSPAGLASAGLTGAAAMAAAAAAPPMGSLAAGARAQAAAVRQHCESLVERLGEVCAQAQVGEEEVAALRQRRDALLAQLARRGW